MNPQPTPPAVRPGLALVAAVARNGVIGRGGDLVWREPSDQRHFRETTMGHAVLMGRKTWESLPARFRPLPGRRNLVLTRAPGYVAEGAEVFGGLAEALARVDAGTPVFVIGGGEIYAEALPSAGRLVLTEIDADLEGDVHFPAFDRGAWREVSRQAHTAADGTRFAFVTLLRR